MQIYIDLISWFHMSMFFFLSLCVSPFVVWKWKMNVFIQMLKKVVVKALLIEFFKFVYYARSREYLSFLLGVQFKTCSKCK